MDSKKSNATAASRKMFKVVQPRVTDLVSDTLTRQPELGPGESVQTLVLDAEGDFLQVPSHPAERRYYCATLRRRDRTSYLAHDRSAQGSRGALLSWTITFGLAYRCCLSALRSVPRNTERLQVYVDYPAIVLSGTPDSCRRQVSCIMLSWAILGISLAIKRGHFGSSIDWIGITLSIPSWGFRANIVAARVEEVRTVAQTISEKKCPWIARAPLFCWEIAIPRQPPIHMATLRTYGLRRFVLRWRRCSTLYRVGEAGRHASPLDFGLPVRSRGQPPP